MATIYLGKATAIIPPLKDLVTLIQVKRPLYEFHATRYKETVDDTTGTLTVWVSEFEVTQDADRVGEIAYEQVGRRQSDGTQPYAFVVRSDNISKQRGNDRSAKNTTNMNVALKEVIKVFSTPTEGSICTALYKKVREKLDNREYGWRRVLQEVASYSGSDVYQWIIESHIKGQVQPMPSSFRVDETKIHLYDRFLAGKEIIEASQISSGNAMPRKGRVVHILSDDTIRVLPYSYSPKMSYESNGSPLVRYRSFDDMPINLQEKIAVLKIAEENEPISNIGVKFDEDLMYILE